MTAKRDGCDFVVNIDYYFKYRPAVQKSEYEKNRRKIGEHKKTEEINRWKLIAEAYAR